LSRRFLVPHFGWKFLVLLMIVSIATAIYQIVLMSVLGVIRDNSMREVGQAIFSSCLVWKSFCNLLIFAIIYWPIRRLDKIFFHQNQRIIIKRHV
jgi:glucan phosphoethanolaminetransferase (alkaline phosphatase superfamily)